MSHTFKLILVLPVIIVYVRRKLPVLYNTGISYPGDGQNYITLHYYWLILSILIPILQSEYY